MIENASCQDTSSRLLKLKKRKFAIFTLYTQNSEKHIGKEFMLNLKEYIAVTA